MQRGLIHRLNEQRTRNTDRNLAAKTNPRIHLSTSREAASLNNNPVVVDSGEGDRACGARRRHKHIILHDMSHDKWTGYQPPPNEEQTTMKTHIYRWTAVGATLISWAIGGAIATTLIPTTPTIQPTPTPIPSAHAPTPTHQ